MKSIYMELSISQQFFDYVKKSSSVVVALPHLLTVDALVAGMGLALFLSQLGKQAVLASSGELPQAHLDFLPQPPELTTELANGQQLAILLNTAEHELDELSYREVGDHVEIFLKAKTGAFAAEDVSFGKQGGPHDLIITLGASTLEDLGPLYQKHAELFYALPKINIDIKSGNEYFGTINLVDVTASSLSELFAALLISYENGAAVTPDMATCFLAGIISATGSFQQPQTTPQTLTLSADLIQRGAHQQDIIVSLYKTKDFSLLKLWGRALARLKTDEARSLLYTGLHANDFVLSESNVSQLIAVLREFMDNMSGYQIVAVMGELSSQTGGGLAGVRLLIAAPPHVALSQLAQAFTGAPQEPQSLRGAHRYISLDLVDTSLAQAEAKLLEIVS